MTKLRMVIGGQAIELDDDPRTFTAAELGAVERYTGLTTTEFGQRLADTENLSVLAYSALAWIGVRRAGQFVPWDAFMETLSVMDLLEGLKAGADDEPVAVEQPVANRADRRRKAPAKPGTAKPAATVPAVTT